MNDNLTELEWTGERYVPQLRGVIALEHLHRYAYACEFVGGKVVLDIASGEGYGSEMLSRNADFVYGIDIDNKSVLHAASKYTKSNLQFLVGSCEQIPLPENSVDVVVSFETIEHTSEHDIFLLEIKRVLKPEGFLIISSPEKTDYHDNRNDYNPYHLLELDFKEFQSLLVRHFQCARFFGQRIISGSQIYNFDKDIHPKSAYELSKLPSKIDKTESDLKPTYSLAICSNSEFPSAHGSFCIQRPWETDYCHELNLRIVSKENENNQKMIRIKDLQQEVVRRDVQIEGLQQEVGQRDGQIKALTNAMDTLRASTSWRLTAPIRFLGHILKGDWQTASNVTKKTASKLADRITLMERLRRLAISLRILLLHRKSGLFDAPWYLKTNPDVAARSKRPFVHFAFYGVWEGRKPSPRFSESFYLKTNPDVATLGSQPLLHYLLYGFQEGRLACLPALESKSDDVTFYPVFSTRNENLNDNTNTDIRAIAIYLPQFHAIPENDEWWGRGFTEWTNVRRAKPQYVGQYQPHVPHPDLGYYDLNDPSVMEKQVAMARSAGIEGFCFYYYWFNGRRLLNMPTDRLLATGKPDFPFCFCWANENWTRTWDGGDKEILIGQEHSYESDELFILNLLPAFRDPRYIRVEGKPLFIMYRPGILPNPVGTTGHWRETCRREGIGEIFLAYFQSFEVTDPQNLGFDAAIQFPPCYLDTPSVNEDIKPLDANNFQGCVRNYRDMSAIFQMFEPNEKLWPCVCPSWDNTARRMERGASWIHSSPQSYFKWISKTVSKIRKNQPLGKRFLFINAWNEWAEGCHLEPDEKHGYAYLNATRLAFSDAGPSNRLRVLVVGHDAALAGAQMLLLTMLKEWSCRTDVVFSLILTGGGMLRGDFEETCNTLVLEDYCCESERRLALDRFIKPTPEVILANTVVVGPLLKHLKSTGAPIVTFVHELQKSIERWAPGEIMASTIACTDHFIAGAKPVALNLTANHGVNSSKICIQEAFIRTSKSAQSSAITNIHSELGLQPADKVVIACGTMDWRKGPDLFTNTAVRVLQSVPEARFIWIGPTSGDECAQAALAVAEKSSRICFIGERQNLFDYLSVGSAFYLSSREDPFPLVALEAADAGLPIVCFADAGGMSEFVGNDCGRTVPFEDCEAASNALVEILLNSDLQSSLGVEAQRSVRAKHDSAFGSKAVLSILEKKRAEIQSNPDTSDSLKFDSDYPLVSVVVPNYNHSKYLPERLASISAQSYRNLEIILLDDKSTDRSLEILKDFVDHESRARLIENTENSGSTFKQWRKGLAEAKGKYVWIAESDDSAHPALVKTLVDKLEANPKAILAACCPRMVDLDGKDLGIPRDWFSDIGGARWEADFSSPGWEIIAHVLSIKNAILNASGVIFRLTDGISDLVNDSMRLCADWLFWVRLLQKGEFEYSARKLNSWRLKSSNARTKPTGQIEWEEGVQIIQEIARILGLKSKDEQSLLLRYENKCKLWKMVDINNQ